MFRKIVVGTDGFGPASRAVERAASLAAASDGELVVVHAEAPHPAEPAPLRDPGARPPADAAAGLLRDVEKRYGDATHVRTLLRVGDPAEVLIDVAEEEQADLIVVGNRGMSKRFPLGVVPNHVSHYAPCHVLIVRTTT